MIVVSVVSHGHGEMVADLVEQLLGCKEISKVIVTKNIPEEIFIPKSTTIHIIENKIPKGFGENHNFAFSEVKDEYFCILNPDVKLLNNPFPQLIRTLEKNSVALVAPNVINKFGSIEDNARYFPTIQLLLKKFFFGTKGQYKYSKDNEVFSPDWVAGMFMFFKSSAYQRLNGFDHKYFLYYEDVDICVRLWKMGMRLVVDPSICVIHDARRQSRKNFFYLKMHLKSMFIYFLNHFGRLPSVSSYTNYE